MDECIDTIAAGITPTPACSSTCAQEKILAAELQAVSKPSISMGLAAVGSASGLIYGIVAKKRWWMVILFMMGGSLAGRGLGYVVESTTKK